MYFGTCTCVFIFVQIKASDFTQWTPETYDYHCSLCDGPLAKEFSTMYGVTSESPLNELDHFHVVDQLPQDIMHVLLEGVIPYELTLILVYFVTGRRYFSIIQLSDCITKFSFAHQEAKDKPSPIKPQICTSQGASLNQTGMNFSVL